MKHHAKALQAEYRRLARQLGQIGWISHGYVQDRGPGAGGPCYQWTRKEKQKTVSVALSKEQYEAMRAAIANWRKIQEVLRRMKQVSRTFIFSSLPDTQRLKPLSKKTLGLI